MKKNRHISKKLDIISLYLGNYRRRINGRQIARSISVSPQTALTAINSMVTGGILSFEVVGKNKEYYLNIKNRQTRQMIMIAEEHNALLALDNKEIQVLISEIADLAESIILFGSFAAGDYDNKSDIDLIVIDKADKKKIEEIVRANPREVNCEFISHNDFKKAFDMKKALAIEIAKKHVIFGNVKKIIDVFMKYHA
ncbi:MAG: nucleotidyltransferase domain-containing protein [Nanoarchaeota archaeon]